MSHPPAGPSTKVELRMFVDCRNGRTPNLVPENLGGLGWSEQFRELFGNRSVVYFLGPLLNEAAALTMLKAHLQRLLAQGKIEGGDVAAFSYKSGAERPLPRYPPRERREPSRWHE